jgi:cephalosporin-C deacetylase-like acetyl esterase
MDRKDIEFATADGLVLRGWLFTADTSDGPHPAISMAHGYAGAKEHGLERFARIFAEAGFVVLVHDHRNFGASDGSGVTLIHGNRYQIGGVPSAILRVARRSTAPGSAYGERVTLEAMPLFWAPQTGVLAA